MTPDRIFYPLAALVAGALIALAAVYPQGEGARSPGPFGHMPSQQTAAAMALARHDAKLDLEVKKASQAMKNQQLHDGGAPPVPAAPLK
jgi:hypothetical protein